jgi:hypothetical protein
MTRPLGKREKGYALLVVLFMGAVIAITLAMSLPRAAFEAQRDKEDDLIYRGSQYSRAVQLFFRKNRRYPGSMEDLEKFNNIRFLRKKYIDPITKQEEWRIVHMGPAGLFTDSLIYDKPKQNKDGQNAAAGPGGPPGPGTSPDALAAVMGNPQQAAGMADRLRAGNASGNPGGASPDPNVLPPGGQLPYSGPPGTFPAGAPPAYFNAGQAGQPAFGQQPGAGPQPGIFAGYPGMSGPAAPSQPAGPFLGPFGAQPGAMPVPSYPGAQPGFGYPNQALFGGQQPNANTNTAPPMPLGSEASRIIAGILTTPRPGGLAGIPAGAPAPAAFAGPGGIASGGAGAFGSGSGAFAPSSMFGPGAAGSSGPGPGGSFGAGIAGVASKSEARGIKSYLEHETYNEWEFVYDYRRDPLLTGGVPMLPGAQAGTVPPGAPPGLFAPGQSGPGQAAGQTAFGFSGFGQSGFGQPGQNQPGFGQPGQTPVAPINPAQPGLPSSPFRPPRSAPGP